MQNGGARYVPKTNGERNPIFERLFVTVSPQFEETLAERAQSEISLDARHGRPGVAGAWRVETASRTTRCGPKVARYGMTQVVITDHETGWRDGGESFTMRTRAAPGKGGDAGQAEYARKIRALGFVYGIYNNYTDYAPVNEFWNEDYVTRMADGQWHAAWPRCYNVKPSRAVELESALAPIIQEKFQLNTAYCDVHTAVRPWSYYRFRCARARGRHVCRHVLRLRRDHVASEADLAGAGLQRRQQSLVLLRLDRRKLRSGSSGQSGHQSLAGGLRSAQNASAVL